MANIPENTTDPILRPVTRLETTTKVFGGEYIPDDEEQRGVSNLQAIELAERDQYIISRVGQAAIPESGDIPAEVGIAPLDTSGKLPKSNNTANVVYTGDTQTLTNKTISYADNTMTGVVGETAAQTLTNKTISYADNTLTGVQPTITGGASSITSSDLTANRALRSGSDGKVKVSSVTQTELEYLSGVTSAIQTQLNGKQATITGGASSITSSNLTASKVLVSDANGKVSASSCPSNRIGVGQVHNATVVPGVSINRARWCVTNGMCTVEFWDYYNTDTSANQVPILTGLPKAKLSGSIQWARNMFYVWENDTRLIAEGHEVNHVFASIVYPVADDWVES